MLIISSLEDLVICWVHTRYLINLKEVTHGRAGKNLFGKRGGDLSKEDSQVKKLTLSLCPNLRTVSLGGGSS